MPLATCRTCGHGESRPARYCAVCGASLPRRMSSGPEGPKASGQRPGTRKRTSRAGGVLLTLLVLALIAWLAHSAARQLDQLAYRPLSERHLQRRLYNRNLGSQGEHTQLPPDRTR